MATKSIRPLSQATVITAEDFEHVWKVINKVPSAAVKKRMEEGMQCLQKAMKL
ncbi:MAG: hypothetical protein MJZ26_03320 [Fibrobacter sp.]|nr:hypothetical protein [Fibrobacter sp.]